MPGRTPRPERAAATVEVAGLTVSFAGLRALDAVDLTIPAGRITAVLGPSGCGKSTLLQCIAGLLAPNDGEVRFAWPAASAASSPADQTSRRLEAGALGYVFQDAALLPWRSAVGNVLVPLELCRWETRGERLRRARQQLERVGLEAEAWDKLPAELSGGMRMRVSIARALATDPSLLLLDEPFSALDELLRRRLGELVLRLWRERARTIVLVTHNIDEALLLSDFVVVMREGRVAEVTENRLDRFGGTDLRVAPAFAAEYARISAALAGAAEA